jgi:hypothetical protein
MGTHLHVWSSTRLFIVRLSIASLLAATFVVAGTPALSRPASAGAFPALLDRNVGSVMNPLVIHNLYWDTAWNTNNPGMSMAQIDDATTAMISSGYFSKLAQYGVASVAFNGSNQADPGCGTAPATFDYFAISGFVLCEKHFFGIAPLGAQGIVYMVYAPRSATFSMAGFSSCPPGGSGIGGFHFQTLPSIIPPDVPQVFGIDFTSCTTTLNEATATGAHELVEAATDPLPPFDWIDNSVASPLSIGSVLKLFTAGEASDLCEAGVGSPAPPPIPPTAQMPQVTGSLGRYDVAYYWSNSDGACVPLPHTVMLAQTGLPFVGTAVFDSATKALPFTTTVADGTFHSFTFPSPVPDPINPAGIRYVTSAAAFSGIVTSNISRTATYTQQFFLTTRTSPASIQPMDVSLTASGWHNAGTVVSLTTDALIAVGPTQRYRFDSWLGGATSTGGTGATITMTAPQTVTAVYVSQHLISFTELGIPGAVPWTVTVNGVTTSGPTSTWFDVGTSLTYSYQTPVPDPTPGTRYVLTSTTPPSPIVVVSGLTVVGQYQTQHQLTVSTIGLGTAVTHIFNGATPLGTATDAAPLRVWLAHGTALSLSADAVVTGAGGLQLIFSSFSPTPPAMLNSPFATTAVYSNIPQIIADALANGSINNHGVANSLTNQFQKAQGYIAAGNHSGALHALRAFIQHVRAQSGHHVSPAVATELELDALLVYHQEICAALAAGQITPREAARDYAYYASLVIGLGRTPLPPC